MNQLVANINQIMSEGHRRGLPQRVIEDTQLDGRLVTLDDRKMVHLGSCSTLGLETHPDLVAATIDAATRFGTQFSSSRIYASVPLYRELEGLLREMFGKPVVVSATTTLGHCATLPTVVGDDDAVIVDMQAHTSMQMAVQLLRARGVKAIIIRHNDMDRLEEKVKALRKDHDKVWYIADGLYSMYGDYAPLDRLQGMLDRYEHFHLYLDDAHGISWAGEKGTGYVRSQIEHHPRMILAVSLNKAFAAGGGAIVFPNEEMARLVRDCGGTMIFSGPIQPPMLGAAVASAKLHLSGALAPRQRRLADLVAHTNRRLDEAGLPQFTVTDSPVFFVSAGLPAVSMNIVSRMREDGFLMNPATFPATPMRRGGVRFVINVNLKEEDIDRMVERLAHHYPIALEEEGSSIEAVAKAFGIPMFELAGEHAERAGSDDLTLTVHRSIEAMDATRWDRRFAPRGNLSARSLAMVEAVFRRRDDKVPSEWPPADATRGPENEWDFHYVTIDDAEGRTVLQTFYTCALIKDDMFAPGDVSRTIEEERKRNPHHLTSRCVMLGSLITKGDLLFIDREHVEWKGALKLLIRAMQETADAAGATQILLQEFVGDTDLELEAAFLDAGLVAQRMPDVVQIRDLGWEDEAGYLRSLGSRYRQDFRREIRRHADSFDVVTTRPQTPAEVAECYRLYEAVYERSFDLNVFKLPPELFARMCANDDYEVIRLYLKDDDRAERAPVAVMFSYVHPALYGAMIVGLDYELLRRHETYKQALYRTVWRAWERGSERLDLAYTAESVKKKVGGKCYPSRVYVQLMDHFNHALIATMATAS